MSNYFDELTEELMIRELLEEDGEGAPVGTFVISKPLELNERAPTRSSSSSPTRSSISSPTRSSISSPTRTATAGALLEVKLENSYRISWDNDWDGTRIDGLFKKGQALTKTEAHKFLDGFSGMIGVTGLEAAIPGVGYIQPKYDETLIVRVPVGSGSIILDPYPERSSRTEFPTGTWRMTKSGPESDSSSQNFKSWIGGDYSGKSTIIKLGLIGAPSITEFTTSEGGTTSVTLRAPVQIYLRPRRYAKWKNGGKIAEWLSDAAGWVGDTLNWW